MIIRLIERLGVAPILFGLGAALVLFTAGACGSPTASGNTPADHTNFHGGTPHATNASSATVYCVSCHGADLQGGTNGEPSCFSCHGREW